MRMQVFCAWCGAWVAEKAGPVAQVYDSICPECLARQAGNEEKKFGPVEVVLLGVSLLAFSLSIALAVGAWWVKG
jgi:hypothetical protein